MGDGANFSFLLNNEEVITLQNEIAATPVTKAITGSGVVHIYTTYTLTFSLSKVVLDKFANSPLEAVKLDVSNIRVKELKVSSSDGKQFANYAACMLVTANE